MLDRRIANMTVGSLGAGDVSLATAASRGVDNREVEGALSQALSLGVTLVDVAPEPDAEAMVGATVRAMRLRDKVVVATHVPLLSMRPPPPGHLVERVEASLRASKLDAIPLAMLALRGDWRSTPAWAELVGTAGRLVEEGKVLAWGAEVEDVANARALSSQPWLVACALPFSLCERAAGELFTAPPPPPPPPPADVVTPSGLILPTFDPNLPLEIAIALATAPPTTAAAPTAPVPATPVEVAALPMILARRPLAGGALAGSIGPGMKRLMRDDRELADADLARIAVAVARLSPLVRTDPPAARSSLEARSILDRPHPRRPDAVATLAELALRFVGSSGAVPLVRLHRREHVAASLTALARGPLPSALLEAAIEILT